MISWLKIFRNSISLKVNKIARQEFELVLHCHLLIHAEIHIYILDKYWHNDKRRTKEDAGMKDAWRNDRKTSLTIFLPLILLQGSKGLLKVACERVLETEHKLHILNPLLWPSRCVFLVLLDAQPEVLGSDSIGAFLRAPSVGCGLPYHIWSLLSGSLLATALGPKLNWVK